jgi:glycosyltransferase involved in cell wall biosynthesis
MLSVIIPARNVASTIVPCLEAVLMELPSGAEVVVADHASKDNTIQLIQAMGDRRVRIAPVTAKSVGAVRNRGADQATGDLLAFIDADCIVPPSHFSRLLRVFAEPEVGAAGAPYSLPPSTRWIERVWYHLHAPKDPTSVKYVPGGNLAIRKSLFSRAGGFDESLGSGEDTEFCQRLLGMGVTLRVDPAIAVAHLGNPKSVRSFYRQQRWHAVGMLGTARRDPTELATLALLAFWATLLAAALLLALRPFGLRALGMAAGLVLAVPALSAAYRAARARAFGEYLAGVLLYLVYFAARTSGALYLLLGHARGTADKRR